MQPLHSLLKGKSQSLTWTDEATASFNATKEALANASLLAYPTPDAPTCLMTDASDTAVGAVLQQHTHRFLETNFILLPEAISSRNPLQYVRP